MQHVLTSFSIRSLVSNCSFRVLLKPRGESGFVHPLFCDRKHSFFNFFIGCDDLMAVDYEKAGYGNKSRPLVAVYKYMMIRDGFGEHSRFCT